MLEKEVKPISKRKDKLIRLNQKDNYPEDTAIILTPKEHSNLLSELLEIKKALDIAKSDNYDISNAVKKLTKENGKISAENDALKKEIQNLNDKITELNVKLSSRESDLKTAENKLQQSQDKQYELKEKLLIDSVIKIDEYKTSLLEIKHLSIFELIRGKNKKMIDELLGKIDFYSLKDSDVKELAEKNDESK